jgi:F-box interacting protein
MVTAALPPICTLNLVVNHSAFVNGALHWLAFRRTDDHKLHHFVLVFDLGDEVFREILLPELPIITLMIVYRNFFRVWEFHCLVSNRDCFRHSLDIWVMKEYGVASSWTKVLTIDDQGSRSGYAIGFRRNGEVVLKWKKGSSSRWILRTKREGS